MSYDNWKTTEPDERDNLLDLNEWADDEYERELEADRKFHRPELFFILFPEDEGFDEDDGSST